MRPSPGPRQVTSDAGEQPEDRSDLDQADDPGEPRSRSLGPPISPDSEVGGLFVAEVLVLVGRAADRRGGALRAGTGRRRIAAALLLVRQVVAVVAGGL